MDVIHGMEENFTKAAALAGETVAMALAVSKAALPMNATNLVQIANQIAQTAEDTFGSKATVLRAADRLSRVEDSARFDAVKDLVLESVALAQEAGNAGNDTLMRGALYLASAGRCYLRLAALHETDGVVTKQPSQANEQPNQVSGPMGEQLWGLRWTGQIASWWSRRKRMQDVEALTAPFLVPIASLASASTSSNVPQGQGELCDRWLGMQTCTLAMSLSLLPYMGRDSLLKDKKLFSDNYLWWVDVFFKVWWGVVAIGVPCSLYGRSWIAQQYARLSGHLGLLGLTVLVGYFSSWILSVKATYVLASFLGITVAVFVLSYISYCAKGDM